MKMLLGFLMFLAAIVFGCCFVLTFVYTTWPTGQVGDYIRSVFSPKGDASRDMLKGIIGYFGFGLPLVACWAAAGVLWMDHKSLMRILGFTCGIFSLVCAGCLVLAVGEWILQDRQHHILSLMTFGVAALASGAYGVRILLESEA